MDLLNLRKFNHNGLFIVIKFGFQVVCLRMRVKQVYKVIINLNFCKKAALRCDCINLQKILKLDFILFNNWISTQNQESGVNYESIEYPRGGRYRLVHVPILHRIFYKLCFISCQSNKNFLSANNVKFVKFIFKIFESSIFKVRLFVFDK